MHARLKIFANLIIWQVANAAGFFRASCPTRFKI
jgi:hypothetical protein